MILRIVRKERQMLRKLILWQSNMDTMEMGEYLLMYRSI
jgi:hypothetical protein